MGRGLKFKTKKSQFQSWNFLIPRAWIPYQFFNHITFPYQNRFMGCWCWYLYWLKQKFGKYNFFGQDLNSTDYWPASCNLTINLTNHLILFDLKFESPLCSHLFGLAYKITILITIWHQWCADQEKNLDKLAAWPFHWKLTAKCRNIPD